MEKTFVYEAIENFCSADSKYLYSLLASISNVDSSYIHYDGYKNEEEHVERVFAYELYRQWCNHPIINNNKYLVVNAEIPKQLIGDAQKTIPLMYPDMVLHYGQNKYKGNLIVCEIKRRGYAYQNTDKVRDDFIKLNYYLSNELKVKANNKNWEPFNIGVFIMTDSEDSIIPLSVSNIKTCLEKHLEEIKIIDSAIMSKIVCVVYNGRELKYDTLFNMINE